MTESEPCRFCSRPCATGNTCRDCASPLPPSGSGHRRRMWRWFESVANVVGFTVVLGCVGLFLLWFVREGFGILDGDYDHWGGFSRAENLFDLSMVVAAVLLGVGGLIFKGRRN